MVVTYNVNRATLILMPTHKLTTEILNAAILGLEEQKRRIDTQITELRAMLHGGPTVTAATPEAPKGKRRKMSAAARKRIGDAQRKRWAESKKTSSPVAPEAPKPKRKLSPAGKRAIVEATKKRWAAKRAAAKTTAPVVAKKAAGQKATAKKTAPKGAVKKTSGKGPLQKMAAKAPEAAATAL